MKYEKMDENFQILDSPHPKGLGLGPKFSDPMNLGSGLGPI